MNATISCLCSQCRKAAVVGSLDWSTEVAQVAFCDDCHEATAITRMGIRFESLGVLAVVK